MATLQERIREFAKSKNLSDAAFERMCSLAQGTINKIGDGKSISSTTAVKIWDAFPDIDMYYLLSGVNKNTSIDNIPTYLEPGFLLDQIKKKDALIDKLLDILDTKGAPSISQSIQR